MIYKGTFTAVLDACVLYPAPLRDILLRLASENLYRPKWTKEINQEWKRNLLRNRNDLDSEVLDNTIKVMNEAFTDARVTGYKNIIDIIELPDANDRHVVAAAIRCNADVIVTENIKDFPKRELSQYDIVVQRSDIFVQNLIDLDIEACCIALAKQRNALNNPPKTREEMRDTLKKSGLQKSALLLYSNCDDS